MKKSLKRLEVNEELTKKSKRCTRGPLLHPPRLPLPNSAHPRRAAGRVRVGVRVRVRAGVRVMVMDRVGDRDRVRVRVSGPSARTARAAHSCTRRVCPSRTLLAHTGL